MQQVVDLQEDEGFLTAGIELVSLSPDPLTSWRSEAERYGVRGTLYADPGNEVAEAFGVMRWAMPSGEPGHTFVLVDARGVIRWVRDYGAPENGGLMYVDPADITGQALGALSG